MRILKDVYLVGSGQIGLSHPFDCHVYLIDGGEELALVDSGAGMEVKFLLANVRGDGLDRERIKKILLTHHHADHSGGCAHLLERIEAKIFLHSAGVDLVEDGDEERMGLTTAKRSGAYSAGYMFSPFQVDTALEHGGSVQVGRYSLEVHHVPGHSPDSVCFRMDTDEGPVMFSGDTVFFGGKIGLLNRVGSNLQDYREHFGKLGALEVEALLPAHHLFVLRGGKRQIEMAEEALKGIQPPPNAF